MYYREKNMTNKEIKEKLICIIEEMCVDSKMVVNENTKIIDDLDFDSLEIMDYIITIEDYFNIKIPDVNELIEVINSIDELSGYIFNMFYRNEE
ncbi:MAG: acyl carrier protein [Lachnospiraceae bacterium]|nr:acyl carrier protein [Lachnospiraceae bacterium]